MEEPVEVVRLEGFDPEGEPEIWVMEDGSLSVMFNFMPPTWAEDDPEPFDDFDQQLAEATAVEVTWDDREVFCIEQPLPDTIDRIRTFLTNYRQ
jgi:hypothetical protein